jgi:Fe-S-cluster containining protein
MEINKEKFNDNCLKLLREERCHANCCGCIPMSEEFFYSHQKFVRRAIEELIPLEDNEVYPATKSGKCVFLSESNECLVYEERPQVCRDYGFKDNLFCPFIKPNGNIRSEGDMKRTLRTTNRIIKNKLNLMRISLKRRGKL